VPNDLHRHLGLPATLTATPAKGEVFKDWSGACSGTGTCPLTAGGAVVATFVPALRRRSLSLRIRASRAVGTLRVADGYRPCRAAAPVVVQRRGSGGWKTVRQARTDAACTFAVPIPTGRGSYRALAAETRVHGAQCGRATSPLASTG
jgi:hypothetical protein